MADTIDFTCELIEKPALNVNCMKNLGILKLNLFHENILCLLEIHNVLGINNTIDR